MYAFIFPPFAGGEVKTDNIGKTLKMKNLLELLLVPNCSNVINLDSLGLAFYDLSVF